MTNRGRALHQLFSCFRGNIPKRADWLAIIGLANESLTTTALMDITTRFADVIPSDVCEYIRQLFERNLLRSDRLTQQLTETVEAINDQGVTPVLFKGAARLATSARCRRGARLMSDLDVMIRPDEVETTIEALRSVDYVMHAQPGPESKWWVEFKRPRDVGMVDLHRELPGPAICYRNLGQLQQHCDLVSIGRGKAYIPTATYEAFILTIHDQFQDYDYWTGSIDLRHLLDLRDLANSKSGIDWEKLAALAPTQLVLNAVEKQLVALHSLLDVDVPVRMRNRFIPRLQYRRSLAQAKFPLLRFAFLPFAALDLRNHRTQARMVHGDHSKRIRNWAPPKMSSVRHLVTLSVQRRVGKA
jgi:Uncharacterised nucleotidyltransferase